MVKFSIITCCLNSQETIVKCIDSVKKQNFKDYEHIIVDGGSTDKTLSKIKKNKYSRLKLFVHKKKGIYQAFNFGLKKSSGNIVHFLNSDDFYSSNNILKKVYLIFLNENKLDIGFFGVEFLRHGMLGLRRKYDSVGFRKYYLYFGIMPPHTGAFIKKKIFSKIGYFDLSYKIASDFDLILKIFKNKSINYRFFKKVVVKMKPGGASNKYFFSFFHNSVEIKKILNKRGYISNYFLIFLRGFYKLIQYFKF
ncbi:glycosyltransferase family 2 protein [Candidatus Pelagibacter sp. HIMB1517]|uniref:glycosyltransferase family 2 protein n=1 Tax=Candidatus Pelagibacter sp. HIMB1517 TaxID=3413341 RepID=UPI003F827B06